MIMDNQFSGLKVAGSHCDREIQDEDQSLPEVWNGQPDQRDEHKRIIKNEFGLVAEIIPIGNAITIAIIRK